MGRLRRTMLYSLYSSEQFLIISYRFVLLYIEKNRGTMGQTGQFLSQNYKNIIKSIC